MGMRWRMGVKKTDRPTSVKMTMLVTRCSRTPMNCGFSPGAADSDSIFSELTCVMASTVAATNQGRPITEQRPTRTVRTIRSRW